MQNERNVIYFDILNIAACIAVIALHHNSIVHQYSMTVAWKQALAFEVLFYWAVPCFFMMSGAKLLDYRERYDTKMFLRKRIIKILVPFIFWIIVITVLHEFFAKPVLQEYTIRAILETLVNYKCVPTFYFFPEIISMYLVMPVLSLLTGNRKILWYIVFTIFLLQSLLPAVLGMVGISLDMLWGTGFSTRVLYIVIGYLLATEIVRGGVRWAIYFLAIFGATFRYTYIYFFSKRAGELNTLFFDSSLFPGVLLAVGVFVLFQNIFGKIKVSEGVKMGIKEISGCTFGIYIIHISFIMPVERIILGMENDSLAWRTVMILVTYIVSLIAVWIMKRIPVIRELVP